jgi:iron complex outermembrane receptor protein
LRGASALLRTPQGLSVFQDGVRINEDFADIVNWGLLPRNAVASIGSNPVFGLNTLGGTLRIQMKNGFRASGAGTSVSGGSFGRFEIATGAGIRSGDLAAFAAFGGSDDAGWRGARALPLAGPDIKRLGRHPVSPDRDGRNR